MPRLMAASGGLPHLSGGDGFWLHAIVIFRVAAPPLTLSIRNSVESQGHGQLTVSAGCALSGTTLQRSAEATALPRLLDPKSMMLSDGRAPWTGLARCRGDRFAIRGLADQECAGRG